MRFCDMMGLQQMACTGEKDGISDLTMFEYVSWFLNRACLVVAHNKSSPSRVAVLYLQQLHLPK